MSYQVIARKWRPQTFEEVTGQEAITRTLRNAVEHDRLHHAYIFSGARGVGKTTTARLLAKALNCHKTEKPNPTPCRTDATDACASCKEIAESRSIDVLEFDAASHTGVDDIREIILESININPARDRYKIFIIDEVHMLSNSSFNALLKTLEEPPARVAFIMATTELHKLPDTILSRCQEFEFRTIALQKIYERLKLISEAEKINISEAALKEISRAGQGSMRDAQSAFDQVISFSGEQIEMADVAVALGIAGAEMLTRVSNAIAENRAGEALKVVDELISRGQDLRNFARDLLAFFRDLLVFKMAGEADDNLLDTAILSRDEMQANSAAFSESDLIRFFNSLSETESKLREATQPRYVLEIGLVKLIEMRRVVSVEKILERLAKLEGVFASGEFPNSTNENAAVEIPKSAPIDLKDFNEPKAASEEKKTLTVDFSREEIPFAVKESASVKFANSNSAAIETNSNLTAIAAENISADIPHAIEEEILYAPNDFISLVEEPPDLFPETDKNFVALTNQSADIKQTDAPTENLWIEKLAAMPSKMSPITAEELEHIEDAWLDNDYERKLYASGDNLRALKDLPKFVEMLIGEGDSIELAATLETGNGSSSSASAFAPAREKSSFAIPVFEEEKISEELPVLPENPTDEDLWRYAESHPLVKKAMRIFRAKIIEVKRTEQPG